MTPIYLNSSSNDQYHEHQFLNPSDHQNEHQFSSPNSQGSLSSNSLTCHLFFNHTTHDQDGVFVRESNPSQNEDDNFGSQTYNDHHVENQNERDTSNGGLKFSLWKRETYDLMNDENEVKWMSSKMRVMLKMKKNDSTKLNTFRSTTPELRLEDHQDHKEQTSSPMEETNNSNSINSTSSNNNTPIRVCSDCNTTKTPLWRGGPQGPKSLCNACGIRQRKARKAMAAAAAAAAAAETNESVFNDKPTSLKATKILHKDHKKPSNGHITKYKKKQYSKQIHENPLPSSTPPRRKNEVEEFLISLRKNLAFHCVFPQDEKEAAILLMALSCGYVHQ